MAEVKTLEDLYESIGGFGRFQILAIAAVLYPELPCALLLLLPVFVGVHPTIWKCTEPNNGSEYFISASVTGANADSMCACDGILSGVGDNSIVSEWGLVCDYAWVADFMTSVQMAGMMIGGPVGSVIADRLGRKKALHIYCFIMLLVGVASPFVNSPIIYAITRFIIGVGVSSYLMIGTLYPIEILTPKWRTLSGAVGPWPEGTILLALLAYFIDSWKMLSWIAALPMVLSLISYPFLPESPRWLLNKGRIADAKKSLDVIAKCNGYPAVDLKIIEALSSATHSKEISMGDNGESLVEPPAQKVGYLQFITNSQLRLKIIVFICSFFSVSLISYGIVFNLKNLGGNIYMNLVYVSVLEAVGFRSAVFISKWFGRRKSFLGYMLFGSIPLVGIILMELNIGIGYNETLATCLALIGRLFIGGGWATVKGFAGESFPTESRSTAMGFTTVAAALGGVAAPQMVYLGTIYRPIPYFVFGGLAVASTFLSLLLPETGGKPLQAD